MYAAPPPTPDPSPPLRGGRGVFEIRIFIRRDDVEKFRRGGSWAERRVRDTRLKKPRPAGGPDEALMSGRRCGAPDDLFRRYSTT